MWKTRALDSQQVAEGGPGELMRLVDDGNGNPAIPAGVGGANLVGAIQRVGWSYAIHFIQVPTTYQTLAHLIWDGTDSYGKEPSAFVVIANDDKGTDFRIKVYDATNQQVILESGILNADTPTLLNLPTPVNFSTSRAAWVIQGKRNAGNGTVKLSLGAAQIDF